METKSKGVAVIVSAAILAAVLWASTAIFVVNASLSSREEQTAQTEDVPMDEDFAPDDSLETFLYDYQIIPMQEMETASFSNDLYVESHQQSYFEDNPILGYTVSNNTGDGQSHESIDISPAVFVKESSGFYERTSAWSGEESAFFQSKLTRLGAVLRTDGAGTNIAVNNTFMVAAATGEEVAIVITEGSEAAVIYYTIGEYKGI